MTRYLHGSQLSFHVGEKLTFFWNGGGGGFAIWTVLVLEKV